MNDRLINGNDTWLQTKNVQFKSRLLVGIEQYSTPEMISDVLMESGSEILIVTINPKDHSSGVPISEIVKLMPNYNLQRIITTSFASSVEDAVMTSIKIRDAMGINFVKLDVRTDKMQIYPNNTETIRASKILIDEGFDVMPMIMPDPYIAEQLQGIGCCAIRLMAGEIRGLKGIENLKIMKNVKSILEIPCVGEAGIKDISDAVELILNGMDAVLVNSAITSSNNPKIMARAMRMAVESALCANEANKL